MENLVSNSESVWISLIYDDGTRRTIHTTFNEHCAEKAGARLRKGYFFDLDHNCYVPYDSSVSEVETFEEKPFYESEVLAFGSRFI